MIEDQAARDDGADNETTGSVTGALVRRLRELSDRPLDPATATVAKQCLLDWLGVAIAARRQPLVEILVQELVGDEASQCVTLLGLDRKAPLYEAVLINGAMGHALDFDDVLAVMGHPTAPVAPAVLGLAELLGASGEKVLSALVTGVEAEARVGALLGPSHYAHGWHGTATFGTFGAAAAASALLELDERRMLHAFGLAGTQASGLKSVFGTMSKPLHAGKAAQSGLLAARLAARGFTSDTDILDSAQGFTATQSTTADRRRALEPRATCHIADALFKYHAACYLTHDTIEAANMLRLEHGLTPQDIDAVTITVQPMHLGVCNIEAPRTGLECKFSLRMTCALAFFGEDTFDEDLFSDATAGRADLAALCARTQVQGSATEPPSTVTVRRRDGQTLSRTANVATPERNLDAQQARVERKFRHLVGDILPAAATERAIDLCRNLERQPDLAALLRTCSQDLRP